MAAEGAPQEIDYHARLIDTLDGLFDEIQPGTEVDEGLFRALTNFTVKAIFTEDLETLSYLHGRTAEKAARLREAPGAEETRGRLLALCGVAHEAGWDIAKMVEVTPEESTWLQLAHTRYEKEIHDDHTENRYIDWTPAESRLLASHFILWRRHGSGVLVEATPIGEERLKLDGYIRGEE